MNTNLIARTDLEKYQQVKTFIFQILEIVRLHSEAGRKSADYFLAYFRWNDDEMRFRFDGDPEMIHAINSCWSNETDTECTQYEPPPTAPTPPTPRLAGP